MDKIGLPIRNAACTTAGLKPRRIKTGTNIGANIDHRAEALEIKIEAIIVIIVSAIKSTTALSPIELTAL